MRIIIAIAEVTTCSLQYEHQNESQNEISISRKIKHATVDLKRRMEEWKNEDRRK